METLLRFVLRHVPLVLEASKFLELEVSVVRSLVVSTVLENKEELIMTVVVSLEYIV